MNVRQAIKALQKCPADALIMCGDDEWEHDLEADQCWLVGNEVFFLVKKHHRGFVGGVVVGGVVVNE